MKFKSFFSRTTVSKPDLVESLANFRDNKKLIACTHVRYDQIFQFTLDKRVLFIAV